VSPQGGMEVMGWGARAVSPITLGMCCVCSVSSTRAPLSVRVAGACAMLSGGLLCVCTRAVPCSGSSGRSPAESRFILL